MAIPVFSVVGKSKSGKTTVIERIIGQLKKRGYRVATIKHHFHPGLDIDRPGKDTWRHARAGSDHVVIAAPDVVASIRNVSQEPTLDELIADIRDVDIIITDGYSRANKPKIEVLRADRSRDLISDADELIAVVSDIHLNIDVPQYSFEDSEGLVNLIESIFLGET